MEKVLITGGSGLIGMRLSEILTAKGYEVRHLSRHSNLREEYPTFEWDLSNDFIDANALKNIDHIIHLAGENVANKRWSRKQKKNILSSRVDTAAFVLKSLNGRQLKSFISASGISYYGSVTREKSFTEGDPAGKDFLAQVSVNWEEAAFQFKHVANRVVALRTGIVLSKEGGALPKIAKPIKMGIGSALGSGNQFMPWIHLDDLCEMYVHAIETNSVNGVYNAVNGSACTNSEMTEAIAKAIGKKLWAPKVPAFLLKLIFGEMAIILLHGSPISNKKIEESGFKFRFNSLKNALDEILK